jgi:hypothetical protein
MSSQSSSGWILVAKGSCFVLSLTASMSLLNNVLHSSTLALDLTVGLVERRFCLALALGDLDPFLVKLSCRMLLLLLREDGRRLPPSL